jgi:hypothetical protein
MAKWKQRTIKLKEGHGWTSRPGNNVFALGRGDVRFEFPGHFLIEPAPDNMSIRFHDAKPPDDNCTLAVSCLHLNDQINWSRFPLADMLVDEMKRDERNPFFVWNKAIEFRRARVRAAWGEIRFIDPNEHREAHSRVCRALFSNVLALVTFDYWEADAAHMTPVWNTVMETMVMADYIEDPSKLVID